jgi:hypothetical protein
MSMKNHGGMISAWGKITICPAQLCGNPTSCHLAATQEELGDENDEFGLTKYICKYFEGLLTCRKILRHGADGFISPPKEGVLGFLSPIKLVALGRV